MGAGKDVRQYVNVHTDSHTMAIRKLSQTALFRNFRGRFFLYCRPIMRESCWESTFYISDKTV